MAAMTVTIEANSVAQDIVRRVRPYLERVLIQTTPPEIVQNALHLEEGWWYIPIRLPAVEIPAYQYYDLLTDAEDEIKAQEHLMVLFVPSD